MRESLAIVLLAAMAGCIYYRASNHNPIMAATSATEFAQVALVERNADKAFNMLHPDAQAYSTKQKFTEILTAMNSPTAPLYVNATDFEPIKVKKG